MMFSAANSAMTDHERKKKAEDDSQLLKIKGVFRLFDKDGDGDIPAQELGTALRALGAYPSEREINTQFKNIDQVEFDIFVDAVKDELEKLDDFQMNARTAFDSFSSDEGKCMDLKEFEKILRTETGEELETEEIRMVLKHIDSMGGQERGKVNPRDLCEDLLKIDRGESAKLKKLSRSVAMIARMNF